MPGTKEIRVKIKSVQNTRKITKAMEMVAASKMRKAQERMRHARPYGDKIRNIAAHLAHANTEYRHPFTVRREGVNDVGLLVVTSDKGLCGGLNTNALRLTFNKLKELITQRWRTNLNGRSSDGSVAFRGFHGDYEVEVTLPGGKTTKAQFSIKPEDGNQYRLKLTPGGELQAVVLK